MLEGCRTNSDVSPMNLKVSKRGAEVHGVEERCKGGLDQAGQLSDVILHSPNARDKLSSLIEAKVKVQHD